MTTPKQILIGLALLGLIALIGFYQLSRVSDFTSRLPEESLSNKEVCRIGFITDVHGTFSKSSPDGVRRESVVPLRNFVQHMQESFKPDILVEGGDFIDGSEDIPGRGKAIYEILQGIYRGNSSLPTIHVMGNHETRSGGISTQEWLALTGNTETYATYDCPGTRILVLDGNNVHRRPSDNDPMREFYFIDDQQMEWLKQMLQKPSQKETVVFIHEPIFSRQEMDSSLIPERDFFPAHRQELEKIFEQYKVRAVFSGHTEIARHYQRGETQYFVLPGIYKSKDMPVSWLQTFHEITISPNQPVRVNMFYKKEVNAAYQTVTIPSSEFDILEK